MVTTAMKECSEFEKLLLLNSLHKANSLNDLMRKADSKADEYVENLFIKIVRKYTFNALQISFSYHYHTHFIYSTVTTFMGYNNISQNVSYPQLAFKPKQVTICKQFLCQKSILHMAWGDLENTL